MAEYIDREALHEAFENADADVMEDYEDGTCDWGFGRQNIRDVINSVPAADVAPVRRWIPVSDGNPKEKGCYLVTVKHWVDGKPVSREAYWNGADWLSCDKRHEITPRVTHWMPLPEPAMEELK